jgi:hypothetical protein
MPAATFLLMLAFVLTALALDVTDLVVTRRTLEAELQTAALSTAYHLDGTPRGYESARARLHRMSERLVTPNIRFTDLLYREPTEAVTMSRRAIEVCITAGTPISMPVVRVLLLHDQISVVQASACAYILPAPREKSSEEIYRARRYSYRAWTRD